jgi:hypothetical protein
MKAGGNSGINPKELLTHVVKLAKKSGFSFSNFLDEYDSFVISSFNPQTGRLVIVLRNEDNLRVVYDSIYSLFFDTSFARALFGECWEEKIMKMAKSKDKLKYIAHNTPIPYVNGNDHDNYQAQTA